MKVLRSSINYYTNAKTFFFVANDALATMLRRSSWSEIQIDNIESASQFHAAIEPYVGDISDFAFPYSPAYYSSKPLLEETILSFFPNSYAIPTTSDSYTYVPLSCSFNNKDAGLRTSSFADYLAVFGGSDDVITALMHGTLIQNNRDVSFFLPIFKESEIANDTLHTINETFAFIKFNYNTTTHTLKIQREARVTYSQSNQINYFANESIPITPEPTPPPEPSDDPYSPTGGPSGPGGGPAPTGGTGATGTGGLHDDTSDAIPIPIPPADIITSAGLITAYNPSASQLANFANKLWNGDPTTIGDWFRLLFGGDAFNAIIGIHLLPVSPATSGSPVHIKLGNWDTEAEAPKITNQYVQHTFGTIMLPEYWGNCIDYAPYTKIQLALPYIGIVDVDTDDVLGSENTLTYNIDVYSGAICAMLRCIKGNLSSVIYQWSGSCGVEIPITGADKSAILNTVVAGSAITGAAGAVGGLIGAVAANVALAGTAASSYGTMKGKVQKQGNFSPNSGALGIMTPYFILTRPVQSVPSSWQADKGYPANISAQLGTLLGYTEVSEINLECSGTEAEKKEIVDLLKKGVLF